MIGNLYIHMYVAMHTTIDILSVEGSIQSKGIKWKTEIIYS